jgi:hypothetical protein
MGGCSEFSGGGLARLPLSAHDSFFLFLFHNMA